MLDLTNSEARERVLAAAEQLFIERGYTAVTLRDIAEVIGIRQASLYYHVPGGKEQLFVEVTERALRRHRAGLESAIAAEPNLLGQLRSVARWLISQPTLNFSRMVRSDMPSIGKDEAAHLMGVADECLFAPLRQAFERAYARGETRRVDPRLMAVVVLSLVETAIGTHQLGNVAPEVIADDIVDVLIDGVKRP